jgi:pyruvate, water dikinase
LNALRQRHQIRWFEDLSAKDTGVAGGKGANLGELARFGMPVPTGFVVTVTAFTHFLEETGIRRLVMHRLASLNVDDRPALRQAAEELQQRVRASSVPEDLGDFIRSAYQELARRCGEAEPFVAVRSSATVEDMPGTSSAGMNETFLNVRGEEQLVAAVRDCWASLYGARVIFYRRKQGIVEARIAIAVVVQQMIASDAAGVMFTVNPANQDPHTVVIEGAFGLGDTVVSGRVSPDHWEVNKDTLEIMRERISAKHVRTDRAA